MSSAKYDTFLSYNSRDQSLVEVLAHQLRAEGITPWLSTWDLVPGKPWLPPLEKALESCDSCCILIGPNGAGPWQTEEARAATTLRVRDPGNFSVIPVILPGGSLQKLEKLSRFLTATTLVEFKDSLNDTDALRRLVCGIRGLAPGPSPIELSMLADLRRESRTSQGVGAWDLSWSRRALASDAAVHFLFGTLHSPPSRQPKMCHYAAALIEKYSFLHPPTVSDTEQIYVAKARQTLTEKLCVFAASPADRSAGPKDSLKILINATNEIPKFFPVPHFWIGTSPPTQLKKETQFFSCNVGLALINILLHCAKQTRRTAELQADLLRLPDSVRDNAQYLVNLLWPVVIAPSYSFIPDPKVQEVSRTGLNILFSEGQTPSEANEPANSLLVKAIEALRTRDFAAARNLRSELGAQAESIPDSSLETALAYIDVTIAIAEGNDVGAERILRDMFRRSADSEPGYNLALLLCWYGRYEEARDVLQRIEASSSSAPQSLLVEIIDQWVKHHTSPHETSSSQKAVEDLAAKLSQSSDNSALLWHLLSAACLDLGLIDTSIECAEKAAHKDSRVLEYRVQHATALLHRFPATPADYQRREPFPVREREPMMARVLLEGVLSHCGAQQTDRFVGTVHHLLGIAYYCAAVATLEPRDRLKCFSRSGAAFSLAQEMIGLNTYQLASYAGQAFLRAREFCKACNIFESIPPESRSKSCETAFIVALAMDNRVDDAVREVTLALERNALSAEAIANVAMLVLQCGLPDDAKRLLRLAVTGLERSSWLVHFLLGRAHIDLGEFEDAEHELWRSISLNSTEPRLYCAHSLAFDQCIVYQARALLSELRQRANRIKADTEFLNEFERRLEQEVKTYLEKVRSLNESTLSGSTVIAKLFEPIRRSVDELRRVVITLGKLLQEPDGRDAEAFLATVRLLLDAAKIIKSEAAETLTPRSLATNGEPWLEFQRALSQDSSWSNAGLRLDDSGADILAHIVERSPQSLGPHWLHLAARQIDVEARGKKLRAYSVTRGVEKKPFQEAVVRNLSREITEGSSLPMKSGWERRLRLV